MTRFVIGAFVAILSASSARAYDVTEKSIAQLHADLTTGRVTSVELVSAYFARIDAIDNKGPALHSVIAFNPDAMNEARAADAAHKAGGAHGSLFGVPVL